MQTGSSRIAQRMAGWYPPVAMMTMIFMASSLPFKTKMPHIGGGDKLLHGFAYAVLAVLCCRALFTKNLSAYVMLGGFVIAAVYGMTDEFHQAHVPSRSGDVYDVLADMIGASQGAVLWYAYQYFRQRRRAETRERPM